MPEPDQATRVIRFGVFEVDLHTTELRKRGVRIRLPLQSFQVLEALLRQPGELVTRKELKEKLWPADSFGDFEHGLNAAVNRVREALGDASDNPRFVETLPRRGYRFLAPVNGAPQSTAASVLDDGKAGKRVASPTSEFLDSIAVLPFENVGGEAEMEYLSDGITTSIINNLSQLHKLRVVPRTTVFRYKGKVSDVAQAGRELRVRVVLTGQVAQRGDGLIVNAELIDTIHESQLWGANYNRRLEDIFLLQAEMAKEITNRLRLQLNDEEKRQLAKRPTESREAYYLLLKAIYWADKWTPEGVRKGVDYIRQALDADPVYAEAWNALAYLYVLIGFFGGAPNETFPKAKAAVVKALEIDDGEADAHATLAFVRLVYDWDWQGAQVELLRAIELGPNLASGHYVYSHWYLTQKLYEEAITEAKLALDIDPLSVKFSYQVAAIHYFSRRYDQAIEQLQKTTALDPLFANAHEVLASAYARKGMRHDAMAAAEKALELSKNDLRCKAKWGIISALTGEPLAARKVLDQLRQALTPPDFSLAYHCAALHVLLGETDEAFACLDKARQGRTVALVYVAIAPELDGLRDDPRFRDLLLSIGIPASRT